MAKTNTEDCSQTRADADEAVAPPLRKRHKPLDTLERVRRELSTVYYAQKDGKLDMDTAKGRAYLLSQVAAVLKAEQASESEIERRLVELEQRLIGGGARAH